MQTKKYPPSSRGPSGMSLPAARKYIRPRIEQLVRQWREQNTTLIKSGPDQITFLGDFGLWRQPDGRIQLFGPNGTKHLCRDIDIGEAPLRDWLRQAGQMKVCLLVLDDLVCRTGKAGLTMRDLGTLEPVCFNFLNHLLGDENGRFDLRPWVKDFLDFLDPEVLELTQRARDNTASLDTYNLITANLATWKSLEAQAPSLMPLVSYMCRKKLITFDCNVFRSLKYYARQNGLTELGWKALCRFHVDQVRYLLQFPLKDCFRLASHYGETGMIPSTRMMKRHIDYCNSRDLPIGSIPAWFDAAAIKEYERLAGTGVDCPSDFASTGYMLALDWMGYYVANGGEPDTHQKKGGWQWIRRQSDAWHERLARLGTTTDYTWASALEAYNDEGYEVVPLTSSVALAAEGAKMHHCVSSYATYCHEGRSRIFSIRKDNETLATAELINHGNAWSLNQNRGPCNSQPSQEVMAVARRLQELYNKATRTM